MSDNNRYSTEIIRDPIRFDALGPAWDALFERALQPHVSQSFEWASCVWETIMKPRGARLHVLVLREGARPVLIWPLVILRHRRFWRAVHPLMMGSDHNEVLVEASPAAPDLAALAVRALRKSRGHDLIATDWMRTDSVLEGALGAVPALDTAFTHSVEWSGFADWAAYERGLSSRQVNERRLRRLRECGHIAFELVEDPDRQRKLITWFMLRKLERLAVRGMEPLWEGGPMENLIATAARRVTRFGKLLFLVLTLDDEPIAVQIAVQDTNRIVAFQIAHEPKFEKYGPGTLIFRYLLQYAFEHRLPVAHGIGNPQFKKGNVESAVSMRLFATTAWGKVRMEIRRLRGWQGQRRAARGAPASR
jgi:CelD/BcsL family acetyltransferase involved in cellulose biosynthesis